MGAEVFENYSQGKNPEEAFKNAVNEAHYWHGHGGYTGTIAEKGDYSVFECPTGVTATQLMDWAYQCSCVDSKKLNDVPEKHRQLVTNIVDVFDDKWGPAVCIPLTGKELAEARKKYCQSNNIKRTSMKFYLFGGWASS
jgi:hypothetical protein